jgi:chromosomal replication initiation ATPase DnaA
MAEAPVQLPLALSHPPQFGRDSFIAGPSNSTALALIERWPNWPAPIMVLSGPAGSGKSHLAHIWAEQAQVRLIAADALGVEAPVALGPETGLAVEDVNAAKVPEQALFHLINSVKETRASLLITSRAPSADWRIGLPDLRSRLRMATPAALAAPDDDLLRMLLVKLFADRQLIVDKAVLDYLLLRMERSLKTAIGLVEALDREALAAGRRITRPMAARVLADTLDEPGEFADLQ